MNTSPQLKLYQIQYDDQTSSKNHVTQSFDVRDTPEYLKREIAHMIRFHEHTPMENNCFYGLLSPKFWSKTHIGNPNWLIAQCEQYSDADIIIVNPHLIEAYAFKNVWQNAEFHHPGTIELTQALFNHAQINYLITDQDSQHPPHITSYCNYWFAKKTFWDAFIPFVKHLDTAINTLPKQLHAQIFSTTDYKSHACFYPFIFERLLTTFLDLNPKYQTALIDLSPWFTQSGSAPQREKQFYTHIKPLMDEYLQISSISQNEHEQLRQQLISYFYPTLKPPCIRLKKLLRSIKKRIIKHPRHLKEIEQDITQAIVRHGKKGQQRAHITPKTAPK